MRSTRRLKSPHMLRGIAKQRLTYDEWLRQYKRSELIRKLRLIQRALCILRWICITALVTLLFLGPAIWVK